MPECFVKATSIHNNISLWSPQVVDGVVARLVMTLPGTNGPVDVTMRQNFDGSYRVIDYSNDA